MAVAAKKIEMFQKGVSKFEFEQNWVELMDRIEMVDEKVSRKADEVVMTMVLSHRHEIEDLQSELYRLQSELKKLQKEQKNAVQHIEKPTQSSKIKNLWHRIYK
ncbi:hypothetical protein N780_12330 [Pontibacillus chungwhensis BH030062]|uniref:Uncharacterized protein n=1 Tax=Pontibacillus chungwhensis BH030062 TaxID=1385513 RepID=A0A0A2VI72_9BACI|nr:hypothetical protein [Pontibacillus chungwhensis]KGP93295.1 hypothetical protein N780_12330 [Pontibacillus chungwhensis BH030062]